VGLLEIASLPLYAVGAIAGGIFIAGYNFFGQREQMTERYTELKRQQAEGEKSLRLEKLKDELRTAGCNRCVVLVDDLTTQITRFEQLLTQKLSHTELTYSKYLFTGKAVYESAMASFYRIIMIWQSIEHADQKTLESELEVLKKKQKRGLCTQADTERLATFSEREAFVTASRREIEEITVDAEEALTALMKVSGDIARLDTSTSTGENTHTMELAMGELRELIERAKKRLSQKSLTLMLKEEGL
jgi:hypothetical protein